MEYPRNGRCLVQRDANGDYYWMSFHSPKERHPLEAELGPNTLTRGGRRGLFEVIETTGKPEFVQLTTPYACSFYLVSRPHRLFVPVMAKDGRVIEVGKPQQRVDALTELSAMALMATRE